MKTVHNKLKRNISKNYLYHFIMNINLTSGVWMIFLAFKGLSLFEIGLMESLFHITSFTMEIPTGAIADIYGRKVSRIVSRFMNILGLLLLILGTNILWYGISFIVSALSYNLESGAGTALVYDSMKEIGTEKNFMKISGRLEIIYQIGSVFALFIGGYLATIDYNLTFMVAIFIGIIGFVVSFGFYEPTIGKVEKEKSHLHMFQNQILNSIKVIKEDRRITLLIICIESFSVLVTTVFFYIQNYMKLNGKNEFQVGVVLAIASLSAAIYAGFMYKIERKLGFKRLLIILPLLGSIGFLLLSSGFYVEVAMILVVTLDSGLYVVISDYINQLIPSKQRATILSFQSMFFSLGMIIIFPFMGIIGDCFGLLVSFRIIAAISIVLLFWIMIKVIKIKNIVGNKDNESEVAK